MITSLMIFKLRKMVRQAQHSSELWRLQISNALETSRTNRGIEEDEKAGDHWEIFVEESKGNSSI
jgi:hypothetical protein